MTLIEKLEGELAALSRRILQLERVAQERLEGDPDQLAAQRVAQELGFAAEVIMLPKRGKERGALARELRLQHWSVSRIARALKCDECTVERWCGKRGPGGNVPRTIE